MSYGVEPANTLNPPPRQEDGPSKRSIHSNSMNVGYEPVVIETANLHRSASDINLPLTTNLVSSGTELNTDGYLKRVLSETTLSYRTSTSKPGEQYYDGEQATLKSPSHQRYMNSSERPLVTIARDTPYSPTAGNDVASATRIPTQVSEHNLPVNSRSSVSLAGFAKRGSWILGSRSPSPSNRKQQNGVIEREKEKNYRDGSGAANDLIVDGGDDGKFLKMPSLQRRSTLGSTKSKRPLSDILRRSDSWALKQQAVPSLPKILASKDSSGLRSEADALPQLSDQHTKDLLKIPVTESSRKKDELWSNFRNLDSEHQKFISKPGTLKANIIRNALLPFLRAYSEHPSNVHLRAEDLDRRVNILNKWWTGLLEMLNGRNGQSVSANERPAILEGLTGIMSRPEFRLPLSAISGRSDKDRPGLRSRSASSVDSTASDFLTESVLHNVRNIFVQNLLSQMAFVVERMSLRSVPASIVTFCGKAAAYAFFFCPGVADILVRLWSIPQATLRRVLDEMGIPRNAQLKDVSQEVSKNFPSHLQAFAFQSLSVLAKRLRSKSPQSLSLNYIPWYGPWVGRWAGRDSDLFFCFAKHFHVLVSYHLPESPSKVERACVPCALLVYAQLLTVMDATIRRGQNGHHSEQPNSVPPVTFDDVLGADAIATPLPGRAPNTTRLIAENRLIMLLREFVSTPTALKLSTRRTFIELFCDLLKAATRRTPLYDHNACFTLCDLVEESITVLAQFDQNEDDLSVFIDWKFWFAVLQQMGESNNTMTEVRLYSFVYSLWGYIVKDERRKGGICLDWLLRRDYAYRQFNHWCPMVRAYYMRLLCWRVARCNGEASEIDLAIYNAASALLREIWCHFVYIQQEAERSSTKAPSTASSSPAPGRSIIIIKDNSNPPPTPIFASFDGMVESHSPEAEKRTKSAALRKRNHDSEDMKVRSSSPGKKRWATLRSINPFSNSPSIKPTMAMIDSETSSDPSDSVSHSEGQLSTMTPAQPNTPVTLDHASTIFKFSLEWNDRNAAILRERKLYPPRLPHIAQTLLQSREGVSALKPSKPEGADIVPSRYIGRALAEWTTIIAECQNFYERRKAEGVVDLKRIETPALGVESFRKPAG